jgi:hypothetical protein
MKSPTLPRHPLDHPGVVKFALSEAVSAALAATGKHHLLITGPSDATTPAHLQGRRIMNAVCITQEQANELYRLASGRHRLVRIKTTAA